MSNIEPDFDHYMHTGELAEYFEDRNEHMYTRPDRPNRKRANRKQQAGTNQGCLAVFSGLIVAIALALKFMLA